MLSRLALGGSVVLSVLFLVAAFSLPLGDVMPDKAAVAVRLLTAAFSHVALIGFVYRRFEAMSIPATKALEVYGQVTRVRGRDFFGPIVAESPAKEVRITLKILSEEGNNFLYNLEYEITFERELSSPLQIEMLVAPVFFSSNTLVACYRYRPPEHWRLTLDLAPVFEYDIEKHTDVVRISHIQNVIKDSLRKLRVYSSAGHSAAALREGSTQVMLVPLHPAAFEVPVVEGTLNAGTTSVRAIVGPFARLVADQEFSVTPPLRTRRVTVVCRCISNITAKHFVSAGECSQVKRTRVVQTDDGSLSDGDVTLPNFAGFSWEALNDWIITPGDWVDIYFSQRVHSSAGSVVPSAVLQEST